MRLIKWWKRNIFIQLYQHSFCTRWRILIIKELIYIYWAVQFSTHKYVSCQLFNSINQTTVVIQAIFNTNQSQRNYSCICVRISLKLCSDNDLAPIWPQAISVDDNFRYQKFELPKDHFSISEKLDDSISEDDFFNDFSISEIIFRYRKIMYKCPFYNPYHDDLLCFARCLETKSSTPNFRCF